MTDQKTSQPAFNTNYPYPLEEETTFIDILAVIVKKKSLILLITSIFALLTICYLFLATPIYKATISFLPPPHETYLLSINSKIFTQPISTNLIDIEEDNRSDSSSKVLKNLNSDNFLYRQFLTKIQSFKLQKEVLIDKNISEKFFGKSPDLENLDQQLIDLHNTISFKLTVIGKIGKKAFAIDKPALLEMTGPKPAAMAELLNSLSDATIKSIIKETQDSLQTLIDNRIKIANITKENIRFKANKNYYKNYSEKIQALSDSLKIAQSLNIKNNNFHLLKKTVSINEFTTQSKLTNSNIKPHMKPFKDGLIPQWYLYGEKALKEEIKVLNSRLSQVISASPETAQSLDKKNNNFYLLNEKDNDSLIDLEALLKQLKSFKTNTLIPRVVLIEQPSISPTKPINLKVEKVLPIGIGLGLLFGIIAAYLNHSMEILRKRSTVD
jgi:LPS O-antigen subunit length determinant protein (WzzB/FepE family)